MRRTILKYLVVAAFVLALAPMRGAMAIESCSMCQSDCDYYCTIVHGTSCFQAAADCGTGTCSFVCTGDDPGHWSYCGCPSGSPIFRKRPTTPAPTSIDSQSITQDPARQICAPAASPSPARPEPKPAAEVEVKPEAATEAKAAPKK